MMMWVMMLIKGRGNGFSRTSSSRVPDRTPAQSRRMVMMVGGSFVARVFQRHRGTTTTSAVMSTRGWGFVIIVVVVMRS